MEEEVVNFDLELAELNVKENTFNEPDEKDSIGEIKETDEFYSGKDGAC